MTLLVIAMLRSTAPVAVVSAAEARFCVTVQSERPMEGDLQEALAAVASGEATITIEAAAACATVTPSSVTSGTALELLASLRIAPEDPAGYDRDLFEHWVDADHDGCDTRAEVLMSESLATVSVGPRCRISDGHWRSVYDGVETSDASELDIDHVVPLAEAWRSGASAWDAQDREAFANDLADERTLRAVTASSNRSKGDQDPAEWLPRAGAFVCQYAADWVTVKVRWDLAADPDERAVVEDVLAGCPAEEISVADALSG